MPVQEVRAWSWIIAEPVVLTVIVVNAVILFLDAFPEMHGTAGIWLFWIDYFCLIFFMAEAVLKIRRDGSFAAYWSDPWNAFDFCVVLGGLPLLISPVLNGALADLGLVLILRMGRLFRFARLMRFVPDAERIFKRASCKTLDLRVFLLVWKTLGELAPAWGRTVADYELEQASYSSRKM